jgi:hypothetical protein
LCAQLTDKTRARLTQLCLLHGLLTLQGAYALQG